MWSQTPTNAEPAASQASATSTMSSTVASSSHGSRNVRVSVWTGSCIPQMTWPSATMDTSSSPSAMVRSARFGQSEMTFGDEVPLDLAGAAVDGGDGGVARPSVDPTVTGGPVLGLLQQPEGPGDALASFGRAVVGLAGEQLRGS